MGAVDNMDEDDVSQLFGAMSRSGTTSLFDLVKREGLQEVADAGAVTVHTIRGIRTTKTNGKGTTALVLARLKQRWPDFDVDGWLQEHLEGNGE
jgi:hypothetical protein